MTRRIATVLWAGLAATTLLGGACSENNDIGPGDFSPPGHCSLAAYGDAGPGPGMSPYPESRMCRADGGVQICGCSDVNGSTRLAVGHMSNVQSPSTPE